MIPNAAPLNAVAINSAGTGQSPPEPLNLEWSHQSLWGTHPVIEWENQAVYGRRLPFDWAHTSWLPARPVLEWGHLSGLPARPVLEWGHLSGLPARAVLEWAHLSGLPAKPVLEWGHLSGLPARAVLEWAHSARWRHRSLIEWVHRDGYGLISAGALEWAHSAMWRSIGLSDQPVLLAAEVRLGGLVVDDAGIDIEQQEGGYWTATVSLVTPADYRRFALGAEFEVEVDGEIWRFFCDRREFSGPQDYKIHGLSIASRYDFPLCDAISKVWEVPILASAACAELLGAITWNLIDWMIPAYRLSCDLASPIAVAREIIETAGGVLDILPDGSFVARPEYPVSPPDYATTAADIRLSDVEHIYELTGASSLAPRYDAVRVSDGAEAGFRDSLDFEADESDGLKGVLHAFPSPWRESVELRTTCGSRVSLRKIGTQTRTIEDEQVEFQEGVASTRYPVASLQGLTWITDSLGAVSFDHYATGLRAAVAGWSLATITYTTRSIDWAATASQATEAQMLLEDFADA